MRITLILTWATAVVGLVHDKAGGDRNTNSVNTEGRDTPSIQPDVSFTNDIRVLQASGFQHAAHSGGATQRTGHLRQQGQPAETYDHGVHDVREEELAHEQEISHLHPYIQEGRSGHYTYAGKSAKTESSNYDVETSIAGETKSSKSRGETAKRPKKQKCK